ncbi:MAG: hypothetical protein IPM39_00045 [Chloroflexi bacterium]|nr:hypothetical protein [Chloroflexota bacterium]
MIYLVGGAPRAGKSLVGQQIASDLKIGWVSTDFLVELLRVKNEQDVKTEWNAAPEAILADAEWFLPYLERFIWGVSSQAENYLIEGVDFLPAQVMELSKKYQIRSVFLGCSHMTLEKLDQYPGRSPGYGDLPEALRRQIAQDVPRWSRLIQAECERLGYPYIDMADDFSERLRQTAKTLTNQA